MNVRFDSKRVLIVSAFLLFLIIIGSGLAARRTDAQPEPETPGVAMQFVGSFTCIFTECGWPAIVILILPAVAVWVWKKFFSLF